MTEFTSVGRSATDRAPRYGSQLVKHFTAKDLEGSWEDTRGFVRFSVEASRSSRPRTTR